MVRTNCHTFDPLFRPLTSAQNPCFSGYQKLTSRVLFFFLTVHNFGSSSLKDPKLAGIWENYLPKCPLFLWLLSLKDPLYKHYQKRENYLFLEQNRAIWWIVLDAFNKGDENKIPVLQAQPTQLYNMEELYWRAGTITQAIPLVKHWGDISLNHPPCDSAHLGSLNKCQVYQRLFKRGHFKCKAQCRAR